MSKQVYKRYSEAFRIQLVREYEKEGLTITALKKRYKVSRTTLQKWIDRYSLQGRRYQMMIIQTPADQDRLKELEAENTKLKIMLADLQLDKVMLQTTLEVVEQEYSIDVKKNAMKSSRRPVSRSVSP